jgi:hypothetical protein
VAKCPATELCIEYFSGRGFICNRESVVEKRVPIPGVGFYTTRDLWNIIDLIAIDTDNNQLHFIQTTSDTNRSSRRRKMEAEADVMFALCAMRHNVVVELVTWKKIRGKWEVKIEVPSIEYGPDQKDHVSLQEVYSPSMAQVRALVRLREQKETAPAKRESRRRPKR